MGQREAKKQRKKKIEKAGRNTIWWWRPLAGSNF